MVDPFDISAFNRGVQLFACVVPVPLRPGCGFVYRCGKSVRLYAD